MNTCPICHQVLKGFNVYNHAQVYSSTEYTCTGYVPYAHMLKIEDWGNFSNYPTYGTSLNLIFPTKCIIVMEECSIIIFYVNGSPNTIACSYNDEHVIITKSNLPSILDFENLPQIVKSMVNNVAFS